MRIGSAKGVDSLNVAHLLGVVHIRGGVEINHTHSASEHHHPLIGVGDCQKEVNLAHRTKIGTKVTKKMSRQDMSQAVTDNNNMSQMVSAGNQVKNKKHNLITKN